MTDDTMRRMIEAGARAEAPGLWDKQFFDLPNRVQARAAAMTRAEAVIRAVLPIAEWMEATDADAHVALQAFYDNDEPFECEWWVGMSGDVMDRYLAGMRSALTIALLARLAAILGPTALAQQESE